jgi:hypothetical protein
MGQWTILTKHCGEELRHNSPSIAAPLPPVPQSQTPWISTPAHHQLWHPLGTSQFFYVNSSDYSFLLASSLGYPVEHFKDNTVLILLLEIWLPLVQGGPDYQSLLNVWEGVSSAASHSFWIEFGEGTLTVQIS